MVKNAPANAGDGGSIPGSGRSPGEGNDNPLQCSCLGNPRGREPGGLQSRGSKRVGHDLATKQQQQGWNCEASWSTLLSASSVTTVQFSTGGSDEGI